MKTISDLVDKATPWKLLALSALALELVALYFQYIMGLEPCIMCIYQRVAIWGIFFAGVAGSLGHKFFITRFIAFAFWGIGAIWGLLIAMEHVEMQSASSSLFFTCDYVPNFPSWAPLHQWLPWLFEATGDCGEISWSLLGYSMPQWMIVTYAIYSGVFVLVLLARLLYARKI
ncbi:disulfide bond formation protein DsbB [Thalassomonas haliotis]|uniref:Disulfide bond formation protein B n=1 Tax=Thalassomonas haliotis TaxID=485448 RepID=A0ABY7VJI3_9GAMM|nr:disulfide bond formation protein DsbB [Thalassomonas haliotis]WDE13904.1 disulfide bond formation protein DsbB [Thalassomonas haliotis]